MKKYLIILITIFTIASCSKQKYTVKFVDGNDTIVKEIVTEEINPGISTNLVLNVYGTQLSNNDSTLMEYRLSASDTEGFTHLYTSNKPIIVLSMIYKGQYIENDDEKK